MCFMLRVLILAGQLWVCPMQCRAKQADFVKKICDKHGWKMKWMDDAQPQAWWPSFVLVSMPLQMFVKVQCVWTNVVFQISKDCTVMQYVTMRIGQLFFQIYTGKIKTSARRQPLDFQCWFLKSVLKDFKGVTGSSPIIPEEMRAHLHERQGGVELDMKEWILDSIRHTMHDKGHRALDLVHVSRVFFPPQSRTIDPYSSWFSVAVAAQKSEDNDC